MKRILWTLGLVLAAMLASTSAFALPTVDQVQAEVKAGRYAQAESMMQEVVAAKPKSAKAHYIYAEILAHDGRFDEAARQARQARELDPAIGFTDPAKFRSFEQLLDRQQAARSSGSTPSTQAAPAVVTPAAPMPAPAAQRSSGLPGWVWIAGIVLVVFLLFRMLARRAAPAAPAGFGPGYGSPGYGGGVPMQPGGSGSGLLGTGIAAAGGFAAGMLAEKMLEGHHAQAAELPQGVAQQGGLQPGMFDDYGNAASELEQRSVDFGNGGDWGGDGGGGGDFGGGSDLGGGGDW
jgi:tetratricopeptide (TPR) repeat protein